MTLLQQIVVLFFSGTILGAALGSLTAAVMIPFNAPRTASNQRASLWFGLAAVVGFSAYFAQIGSISSMPAWNMDAPNTLWYLGFGFGGLTIFGLLETGLRKDAAIAQLAEQRIESR